MSRPRRIAGLLLALVATGAMAGDCDDWDPSCAQMRALAHPIRNVEIWKAALARPVEERFGPASTQLAEYLRLVNVAQEFKEKPRPGRPGPEMIAEIRAAIAEMPAPVRRLFDAKFAGLYFIEDLGGSGFTDRVYGKGEEAVAAYVVIDTKVLEKRTANQWATWKENTPFQPDPDWKLTATIERKAEDNRKNAIQYILLHELGHVLSAGSDVLPNWNFTPREAAAAGAPAAFPFFALSWVIDEKANRFDSRFESEFPQRVKVAYYTRTPLLSRAMLPVYDNLVKTNFPTLYAATVPGDDFAESFASYVHVVLMGRPWEITIEHEGKVVKTFGACWEEPRCQDKRRILERIVGPAPAPAKAPR
jgi:hypothetical protein